MAKKQKTGQSGGAGEPKHRGDARGRQGGGGAAKPNKGRPRHAKVSGGGGEQDFHHTHDPALKGGQGG